MPSPSLADVLRGLRKLYGEPSPPISTDPFRLILWEQVAYLVPDAQRREAYMALRDQVGLTPRAILAAPRATLQKITRLGGPIAAASRASRLQQSAELAIERWDGNLNQVLRLPLVQARRALAAFPMIGEPGADKILVFTKTARLLPLDSNGLRVLQRLGLAKPAKDYRTAYRSAQANLAAQLPKTHDALIAGYQLLRQHGQELCRRSVPQCSECSLQAVCPTGRRTIGR